MSASQDLVRRQEPLDDELELLAYLLEDEGGDAPAAAGAIAPRPPSAGLPLSFAQQRLWFLDRWRPDTAVYNIASAWWLRGRLDRGALAAAVAEVVRRHEALRAVFSEVAGSPLQELLQPSAGLPLVALDPLPAERRQAAARRLASEVGRRPFALAQGPLFRTVLVRLGPAQHLMVVVLHHLVADGWSMNLLIAETASLYRAFAAGEPSPLPELTIQYADFAWWQRGWLSGEALALQVAWWRDRLAGAPELLELPTDRPRPPLASPRGAVVAFSQQGTTAPLAAFARERDATPFMVLLASFQALLSRHSGQLDVVVGVPIAGRTHPELEGLIGLFVNTLALRGDLSGDPTFEALLGRTREIVLGAYDRQEVPFEALLDELKPHRDPSRSPVFQVMLVLQSFARQPVAMPGLDIEPLAVETSTAKFDLLLELAEAADGLRGRLEYRVDLFDRATMARLLGHFGRLLESGLAAPGRRVGELPLLGEGERWQLVGEHNDSGASWPGSAGASLQDRLAAQAARTPEAVAVAFAGEVLSYGELERRANAVAWHLRGLGVAEESVVGVLLERSVGLVVALVGVLKAGAAYLPLEPSYPRERLGWMVADAAPAVVLSAGELAERLPAGSSRVARMEEWLSERAESPPSPSGRVGSWLASASASGGSQLAYVIYTSGSTGRPKGAMVTQAGICNRLSWMQSAFGLTCRDRVLQKTPTSFDVSVWELFWPLTVGACLVVARPEGHRDSAYLAASIVREGVTTVHFVPSMLRAFLDEPEVLECGSLRRVMASGEALTAELAERFRRRLGGSELHNLYGPTEASVDVTWWRCGEACGPGGVPIGRPVSNTTIHVLDGAGEPAPLGVAGELCIGGVQVGRGYLGRPELTAERFVPDALASVRGERLYRTGDRVRRLAGGELEFLGRLDFQVKVRGLRIELGEVEAALASHPGVRAAVAMARPDAGGGARLAAWVVPRTAPGPSAAELREHLLRSLPEPMVPTAFVALDALPLTTSGKLDRRALPDPAAGRPAEQRYEVPANDLEEILAGIWGQVLEVDPIGVEDNFFVLGGDSILSLRVTSLARERGLTLSLQQLFQQQTVRRLARAVAADPRGGAAAVRTRPFELVAAADRALVPAGIEDAYPLTMLQAGMLYHMQAAPESPVYHNVNTFHLRAPFDAEAFRCAVQAAVDRHPVLRTSFDLTRYSEPLQLVHTRAELAVGVTDLRRLPAARQAEAIHAFVVAQAERRFALARPPLLRFHLHRRSDRRFQLTLTESHAVSDGWSLHSTLDEIFRHYFALIDGQPPPAEPAAEVTFRDFVRLEQLALASEPSRAYWSGLLQGAAPLRLPSWPEAPAAGGPRVRQVNRALPAEVCAGLFRLARTSAVPLKSVLLAAHCKVLALLCGRSEVLTVVVANGRPEAGGGERLRGLFLNTLPLRLRLDPGSWRSLVRAAFEAERAMLPHRRFPFAALQRQWGSEPLSDVSFNFTNFHVVEALLASGRVEVLRGGERVEETNFALAATLTLDPGTSDVGMQFACDRTRLHDAQIELILDYYTRTFALMARDAEAEHTAASLLAPAERHQVLTEWNDSRRAGSAAALLPSRLGVSAAAVPDRTAVLCAGESLTYGELDRRANRLANRLRRAGIGPEVVVGICAERSPAALVGLLAIWRAGGAYLPLDPTYPPERLRTMIEDSGLALLVGYRHRAEQLAGGAVATLCFDRDAAEIAAESAEPPPGAPAAGQLAYLLYTSGSTGRPKGVQIPHGALASFLGSMLERPGLDAGDVLLAITSLSFDIAALELYLPLLAGATVALAPPDAARDGLALKACIAATGATVLQATPSGWRVLLEAGWEGGQGFRALAGGEALPPDLAERLGERAAEVWNLYGPTETTVYSAIHRLHAGGESAVPIGRPIANTRIYVLGPDLQPLAAGVTGELWIGGAGLSRGYWRRPDLTAERFLPDPWGDPGARMYRTGDLAALRADGTLDCLGRVDQQIKIRGLRVEIGEIEVALAGHPAVRAAVVVARQDETGKTRLLAYVVPEREPPAWDDLHAFLRGWLPDALVPADFILLPALPLTPNGKLDRRALPAVESGETLKRGYQAPRTGLERALADLWQQVLAVARVGVHDSFFALGGDSIASLRLIARAHQAGMRFTARQLFEHPTIGELAPWVETGGGERDGEASAAWPPAPMPASLDGPAFDRLRDAGHDLEDAYPLSPLQQGLLFHALYDPEAGEYFIQLECGLHGDLRVDALRQAWERTAERLAILRTSFLWQDREAPLQVTHRRVELPWDERDWRDLPEAQWQELLAELMEADRRRGFDPARPPLMRFALVRVGEHAWRFLWSFHHVLLDGWSEALVLAEVFAAYRALVERAEPRLPPARPFRDYIDWLQRLDPAPAMEFWRHALHGLAGPTVVPGTLTPAEALLLSGYEERQVHLPAEQTRALLAFARDHRLTLNTVAQGALALLLGHAAGRRDVVFGLTFSGRPSELRDVEQIAGLFINTLPLRVRLPEDATAAAWLAGLHDHLLELQRYEHSPLTEVQKWSGLAQATAPLFEVIATFENHPRGTIPPLADLGLEVREVRHRAQNDNPLTVLVVPGPETVLGMLYDRRRYAAADIDALLDDYGALLGHLAGRPEARLAACFAQLDDAVRRRRQGRARSLAAAGRQKLLERLDRGAGGTGDRRR